jgi:hypothetical protein
VNVLPSKLALPAAATPPTSSLLQPLGSGGPVGAAMLNRSLRNITPVDGPAIPMMRRRARPVTGPGAVQVHSRAVPGSPVHPPIASNVWPSSVDKASSKRVKAPLAAHRIT